MYWIWINGPPKFLTSELRLKFQVFADQYLLIYLFFYIRVAVTICDLREFNFKGTSYEKQNNFSLSLNH